jgi:hypothetical protein
MKVVEAADTSNSLFRLFSRPTQSVASSTPHPAVVRVIVEEGKALANGSGSLVAARDQYGLVVTNWHVVRQATGKVEVVFPSGFRSAATVLKTDEDWDLAALLVWRSDVMPLAISNRAPQPGDVLTIAGYGPGDYRAVSGKCTQYVAPSPNHPFEIVELSAQARQGDSGGPILNEQGELAGVLFGANSGSTTGSFCIRVRTFLASVWPDLDSPYTMPSVPSAPSVQTPFVGFNPSIEKTAEMPVETPVQTPLVSVDPASNKIIESRSPSPSDIESEFEIETSPSPVAVSHSPPPPISRRSGSQPDWSVWFGDTNWDRAKTMLAIIGLLTVWGHVARFITK